MGTFKQGDIVQLKSGGPKMTICGHIGLDHICQWFSGSKLERGNFPSEALVVPSPEEKKGSK